MQKRCGAVEKIGLFQWGCETYAHMNTNPTLTLPFAGEGIDRARVGRETPSPAQRGWDGGVSKVMSKPAIASKTVNASP